MKLCLLLLSVILNVFGQSCYIYGCGQLNAGQCVGAVNFGEPTINVNSCPDGQACLYSGTVFKTPVIGNSYCVNKVSEDKRSKKYDIYPGDICDADIGDTCHFGSCVDNVCVS